MVVANTYINLKAQIEKLRKHANQGSINTRYRYFHAMDRFCQFIAMEFKLQKVNNIKPKHVLAYTTHLQTQNKSSAYIKTELSGIRFFCDEAGIELITNDEIGKALGVPLERRKFGNVPKAWNADEYEQALSLAVAEGQTGIALTLTLAYILGLRIHETIRLTKSIVRQGLSDGYVTIKGKGGLIRQIPLTGVSIKVLKNSLEGAHQERIFVEPEEKAHQVQKRIENWIYTRRHKFTKGETKLVYHGLRHTYAQGRYTYHLHRLEGNEQRARLAVAEELGHGRDDVTRIYLAGYKEHSITPN